MRHVIIFLGALLILGCNYVEKPIKPDNLISQDKMVDILYDVYILTSAKGTTKLILEDNGIYPEDYVFEKHKIDSLQFALSNEYYGFRVEEYESIIFRVEERYNNDIIKFQAKIDKEGEDRARRKASIKKLSKNVNIPTSKQLQETRKVD